MNSSGGSTLRVHYAKDSAVIDAVCTVIGISEHLISLEILGEHAVPNLGAMVELEVGRRWYRSTVQHTEIGAFTVLRPRELEHLSAHPIDLAIIDTL